MPVYRRSADWSVGYYATLSMDPSVADYTGWVFALRLAKFVGDAAGIPLGIAASPADDGFRIHNGPARLVTLRIKPATLQAYPDSSGSFELFGNVLATPAGGERFHAFDLVLTIVRGPTI